MVPTANAQSRAAMMVDGNWFILSTDISGLNWYHIQQTRHLLYKNVKYISRGIQTYEIFSLFRMIGIFRPLQKTSFFAMDMFKAFFLCWLDFSWNTTIIACCSCRIGRYHVCDDSMENCNEYCKVKATVYHIGTECPLSGLKFSSAETGMGVTSRP